MNFNNIENENEDITLPPDTINILMEFLKEKEQRENLEKQRISSKDITEEIDFEENWQLSQFWYSDSTKSDISNLCKKLINNKDNLKIGLLSCPSLYKSIKTVHSNTKIFEFDQRFSAYGDDFVFYDYNQAHEIHYLNEFKSNFDIIIADPPFLSEECISKISIIIKKISNVNAKILFCSGETVNEWIKKYLNLNKFRYQPKHNRNLGNEFAAYANFDLDSFI